MLPVTLLPRLATVVNLVTSSRLRRPSVEVVATVVPGGSSMIMRVLNARQPELKYAGEDRRVEAASSSESKE